jgi:hypothetical protein
MLRIESMRNRCCLLFVIALLAAVSGCNRGSAEVDALRNRLVLADEPQGATSIADSRDKIDSEQDVVVVGKIGAGEFQPWAEGQAAFLMSEVPVDNAHASSPGHDPATCPFCRRRAEKAASVTALVQFRDEKGELLPIDARELLGVSQDQIVVVRGKGHVDKLGVLVVAATGIHVRN